MGPSRKSEGAERRNKLDPIRAQVQLFTGMATQIAEEKRGPRGRGDNRTGVGHGLNDCVTVLEW
jgi:hypothetical protein